MELIFLQWCVLKLIKVENLKKTTCMSFFIVPNNYLNISCSSGAPVVHDVCTKIVYYIF